MEEVRGLSRAETSLEFFVVVFLPRERAETMRAEEGCVGR